MHRAYGSSLAVVCLLFVACSGKTIGAGVDVIGGDGGAALDSGAVGAHDGGGSTSEAGSKIDGGETDGGGTLHQVDKTAPCDTGVAIDGDAAAFAKAMGICHDAAKDGFGLVSASYAKAWGTTTAPVAGQWGLLPKFGSVIRPREGSTLGALSSGYAREYDDLTTGTTDFVSGQPLYTFGGGMGAVPPGFPKAAKGCTQDNQVSDMIVLKLTLKAPPDASGFRFDFNFYSSEWPNYVCSNFNDAFIAYVTSTKVKGDNISIDPSGNAVGVNNSFLDRCTPGTDVGCSSGTISGMKNGTATCVGGDSELTGTGYGTKKPTACTPTSQQATAGGATGWLTSQAPVTPGETFTLELMIFDAGDEALDSTVLLDNFQWLGGNTSVGTGRN